MATAVADVAAARRDYLDESGGRYVHVIADGAMTLSGDIAKALAWAPTPSWSARRWPGPRRRPAAATTGGARPPPGAAARRPGQRRHDRHLEQILHGPSDVPDGSMNLMGALRRTMATAGYTDLKEFQRVEVVVAPYGPGHE